MVLVRCGRHPSGPGAVHQQLAGVGVDEGQGVFQHVCRDLLQDQQVAARRVLANLHLAVGGRLHRRHHTVTVTAAALTPEQLAEELGPGGQDVLVGGKDAVARLQRDVVDGVRLVGLLQKVGEVLVEAGRGDAGNLKQAAQKEHPENH